MPTKYTDFIPDIEEEDFVPDVLETPTGLPSINAPIEAPVPFRAKISPLAGQAAGFEVPVPPPIAETIKSVATSFAQPEALIPTAAGIAGSVVGGPAGGIVAAGLAGEAVKAQRLSEEAEKERPKTEIEALTDQILTGLPFGEQIKAIDKIARSTTIDAKDAAKDVIEAGLFNAGIEGLSYGAARVLGKAPTLAPRKTPVFKELENEMAGFGVKANAAQATDSRVLDWLDGVARTGPLSSDIMKNFDHANKLAMDGWLKNLNVRYVGALKGITTDEQIGMLLDKSINLGRAAHKKVSDILYEQVDDLAGGTLQKVSVERAIPSQVVNPKTGKPFITKGVDQVDQIVGGVQVPTKSLKDLAIQELRESSIIKDFDLAPRVKRMLSRIASFDDVLNFQSLHKVRSYALDVRRMQLDPGVTRIASRIIEETDNIMESASKSLNPKAFEAWRKADAFYRLGKETYETDFMSKLFIEHKKAPQQFGKSIFRNGASVDTINQVKSALKMASDLAPETVNYEDGLRALKTGYQEGLLDRFIMIDENLGKTINFEGLLKELEKRDTTATMDVLFTPEHKTALKNWAKAGQLVTQKQGGGHPFSLIQAAAIFGVVMKPGASSLTTAGMALTFPTIMAELLTRPSTVKLLTKGFSELGKNTVRSTQAAFDFTIRAAKEYVQSSQKARTRFEQLPFENPNEM